MNFCNECETCALCYRRQSCIPIQDDTRDMAASRWVYGSGLVCLAMLALAGWMIWGPK